MKVICDASEKCPAAIDGSPCGHHIPHESDDGCEWSCCIGKHLNKTGKCVPVKEDES